MKKVIALILAIITAFSVCVVAFAADEAPAETAAAVEATEEEFNPMDLPVWLIPVALKVGKIALKLAKVFVKIAAAFGIIDTGDIIAKITDFINGIQKPDTTPETTTTTTAAAA